MLIVQLSDAVIVARLGFTWLAPSTDDALALVVLRFGATPMTIIGIAGAINPPGALPIRGPLGDAGVS